MNKGDRKDFKQHKRYILCLCKNVLSTYNNTDNSNEKKSTFSLIRRERVVGENMHEGKMEHGLGAGHTKSMTRSRPLQRREADD